MDKLDLDQDVKMELERIQRNIPKDLMDNLVIEQDSAKVVKEVINKALEDDEFPEEKKEKYRRLLKSGELDGKIEVVDEEVQEKIEEYVDAEVEKSIKAGRLPDRDSDEFKSLTNPLIKDDKEGTRNSTEE